jgi:hypothetical protein
VRVRQQNNPGHGIVQIVEPIAGQADHARGYLTVAGWTREYAQIYSFTSELCKVAGLRACFFFCSTVFLGSLNSASIPRLKLSSASGPSLYSALAVFKGTTSWNQIKSRPFGLWLF